MLAIAAGILAGGIWGGIAGFLRATVGAHEVITTIMLNWIAIYGGVYLFERERAAAGRRRSLPRFGRDRRVGEALVALGPSRRCSGIFIALAARRLLGAPQPDDARLRGARGRLQPRGGSLRRDPGRASYFLALAISGAFAGLAGAIDVIGVQVLGGHERIFGSTVGFTGIAVALLGRNKPVGIFFAGLLFAALKVGTSSRQLDPEIFDPALATDLSTMIQALVIFFVGAELADPLHLARGAISSPRAGRRAEEPAAPVIGDRPRDVRRTVVAIVGIVLGVLAFWLTLPPWTVRDVAYPARARLARVAAGPRRVRAGRAAARRVGDRDRIPRSARRALVQGVESETLEAVLTAGLLARRCASRRRSPSPRWAASSPSARAS